MRCSHKRGSAATLLLWLNRLVAEPDRGLAAEVIQSLQIPELGVKFSGTSHRTTAKAAMEITQNPTAVRFKLRCNWTFPGA